MKAYNGKAPTKITPSPRSGIEDSIENLKSLNIEPIRRSPQSDSNKCLATGQYTHSHAHPRNAITTHLKAAHIIPFTLRSFQANNSEAVNRHTIIWTNLRRYFLVLLKFGQFRLNFEAIGSACQVQSSQSWELPDPPLLEIHACIGNFLHMSGQVEIIDKALKDFEDCGGIAPSGSTNIEDLLAVSDLSMLPSNVDETSDSQKFTERKTILRRGKTRMGEIS
ncbi:hypothetical protein N7532_010424 [Penicillium argentinense]|uniref:HNH nuclease domain-containing protein n=1 Tax=Penicillium argentinense TaxID=1131581 RepID=A0A9W9EPL5_9EURO|nr:uncharacterized protein N7532_010424 [Penicillium argentinense]KAJ5085653.1 hypothetical protein N7532_010424 [Penicillium argentinense]